MLTEHVENGDGVRILAHNDADGVAAGGIICQLMMRLDATFKASCEKRVDESLLKDVQDEESPLVIFSDMGAACLDMFEENLTSSDISF